MDYKPTLYTRTNDMSMDQLYSMIGSVKKWCEENLPPPVIRRRTTTKVMVYKEVGGEIYGAYTDKYNWIVINLSVCHNLRILIRTVIHEYVHTTQDLKDYNRINKRVGYEKNPYELQANKIEQRSYKKCWDEIKGEYTSW